uniref:Reverse transcriptase domain-containing protein n=1 Tax=Trichobilharzia regenti TaxID=157069 RepID=A0AA85KAD5_TRIRE|nr:unnamed protein product [Trichobilharzia regenti]
MNFNISNTRLKPEDIIPVIETALEGYDKQKAEPVRAQCALTLKKQKAEKPNITKEELKALQDIKADKSIVITQADKGNTTVLLNKTTYNEKMNEHLQSGPYTIMTKSAETIINKTMKETANVVRQMKEVIGKSKWFEIMPKSCNVPRIYGKIKLHKEGYPIRPIVDFRNTPTYMLSRFLSTILRPTRDNSKARIVDSFELVRRIKTTKIEEEEILVSFDVNSLYTKIPIQMAMIALKEKLNEDKGLKDRTQLSVEEIIKGVEFCLTTTCFTFEGKIYQQNEGVAMGSTISPIIADIFMDYWEENVLKPFRSSLKCWWRYVDDTLVIVKKNGIEKLFSHINRHVDSIKFTMELENEIGELPMLDCKLQRMTDGSIKTTMCRKATHSGRFLDYYSAHPLSVKRGLIQGLADRIRRLTTAPEDQRKEIKVLFKMLLENNYPREFIKDSIKKSKKRIKPENNKMEESKKTVTNPYKNGTSEAIQRNLKNIGIRTTFKPTNLIKNKINQLKDPIKMMDKNNLIYKISCANCPTK